MKITSKKQLEYYFQVDPASNEMKKTLLEMFDMDLLVVELKEGTLYFSPSKKGLQLVEETKSLNTP